MAIPKNPVYVDSAVPTKNVVIGTFVGSALVRTQLDAGPVYDGTGSIAQAFADYTKAQVLAIIERTGRHPSEITIKLED